LTFEFFTSQLVRRLHAIWTIFKSVSGFLPLFVLESEPGASKTDRQTVGGAQYALQHHRSGRAAY